MRINKSQLLATLIASCISINVFAAEINSKALPIVPETNPAQAKKPQTHIITTTLKQDSIPNLVKETEQLMQTYNTTLNSILSANAKPTWQDTLNPLVEILTKLKNHLNNAILFNTLSFNPTNNEQLSQLKAQVYQFHQQLLQNERLYQLYLNLSKSSEFNTLTSSQQQYIKESLVIFQQYGINLTERERKHQNELIQQLGVLGSKYMSNIKHEASKRKINIPSEQKSRLNGIPVILQNQYAYTATSLGETGWTILLDSDAVAIIETFAVDRELRKQVYTEHQQFASDGELNNAGIVQQILAARYDLAKLLGYDNYAQYAFVDHAPPKVAEVNTWLLKLSKQVLPIAEQELAKIADFAFKKDGIKDLQSWDIAYYAQLLETNLYGDIYNQAAEYLPVERVILSLFNLNSILFGLQIAEVPNIKSWNKNVKQYVIRQNNTDLAYFYLDLYSRDDKQASPNVLRGIERFSFSDGTQQLPIAVLNANYKLTADKQTLLTVDQVTDLFSSFGYMLASLLNNLDYPSLNGTSGFMQDGLIANAKFMGSLIKQRTILQDVAKHYKTGAEMPETLINKILEINNYNSGLHMLAQIEIALLGLELNVAKNIDLNKIMQQLYSSIGTSRLLRNNNLYNQIPIEFASNNASLEWIDLWSMNIAANTLEQFKAHDLFSRAQGQKYMQAFIQPLGSKSILGLYLDFSKNATNDQYLINVSTN